MLYNFPQARGTGRKGSYRCRRPCHRCALPVGRACTQCVLEPGSSDRAAGRRKTSSRHGASPCEKPQTRGRMMRNGRLPALIENFSSCLVGESAAWEAGRLHNNSGSRDPHGARAFAGGGGGRERGGQLPVTTSPATLRALLLPHPAARPRPSPVFGPAPLFPAAGSALRPGRAVRRRGKQAASVRGCAASGGAGRGGAGRGRTGA